MKKRTTTTSFPAPAVITIYIAVIFFFVVFASPRHHHFASAQTSTEDEELDIIGLCTVFDEQILADGSSSFDESTATIVGTVEDGGYVVFINNVMVASTLKTISIETSKQYPILLVDEGGTSWDSVLMTITHSTTPNTTNVTFTPGINAQDADCVAPHLGVTTTDSFGTTTTTPSQVGATFLTRIDGQITFNVTVASSVEEGIFYHSSFILTSGEELLDIPTVTPELFITPPPTPADGGGVVIVDPTSNSTTISPTPTPTTILVKGNSTTTNETEANENATEAPAVLLMISDPPSTVPSVTPTTPTTLTEMPTVNNNESVPTTMSPTGTNSTDEMSTTTRVPVSMNTSSSTAPTPPPVVLPPSSRLAPTNPPRSAAASTNRFMRHASYWYSCTVGWIGLWLVL